MRPSIRRVTRIHARPPLSKIAFQKIQHQRYAEYLTNGSEKWSPQRPAHVGFQK